MNPFFTTRRLGAIAASLLLFAAFSLNASLPAQAQSTPAYQLQSPTNSKGVVCGVGGVAAKESGSADCGRGGVGVTPWDTSGWGPTLTKTQSYNTQSASNDTTSLTLSQAASSNASNALSTISVASSVTYDTLTTVNTALGIANTAYNQAVNASATANSSANSVTNAVNYNNATNSVNSTANYYATTANNTANSANYTASVANNISNNNVAVAGSANSIAGNAYAVGAAAVNAGNAAVNTANAAYGISQGHKAGGNIVGIQGSTCGNFHVVYSNGSVVNVTVSSGCSFGGH